MDFFDADFSCSSVINSVFLNSRITLIITLSPTTNLTLFFCKYSQPKKKISDLIELLESLDHVFSLIILNETWLEASQHELFQIEGYDLFSVPRNRHGGRGVNICEAKLSGSDT